MSFYVHGTHPEEQARLSTLNSLLNEAALKELHLKEGEKVVDIGCGLAQLARMMAKAVGMIGRVVGIERSPEQLGEAIRQARGAGEEKLVDLRQGDALALPLRQEEWGSFDIAHARFLLEHVRDPLAVVRMMVQAVRSGGRIVLQDDDHDVLRLWPEPAGIMTLWRAYIHTYQRLGNDPSIGRKLVSLLHESGVRPVRNHWLFFGSCSGQAHFELYADNLISILMGAREAILTGQDLTSRTFDGVINALGEWKKLPYASIWYSVFWAEGKKE